TPIPRTPLPRFAGTEPPPPATARTRPPPPSSPATAPPTAGRTRNPRRRSTPVEWVGGAVGGTEVRHRPGRARSSPRLLLRPHTGPNVLDQIRHVLPRQPRLQPLGHQRDPGTPQQLDVRPQDLHRRHVRLEQRDAR